MEEDAEALEKMYADILSVYPPGPMRAFWLAQLRRAALLTRCPHWPLGREQFLMSLCDPSPRSGGTALSIAGQSRPAGHTPARGSVTSCAVFGRR
ncbi:MAG: hypothetical protein JSR66_31750 [Proteobacteria bacterium]|nr:hypothetical protein [Pseudomonadota bacterium]